MGKIHENENYMSMVYMLTSLGSKNLCWTSTLNPNKMEELI